ncbi:crotonase/enoyl-CoA hydratase family protein [Gordonia defluvii]|uniref:Crotonase/enoyl-CoA hydratase family protein n=1 Tax=Gordonia defluvii TaxID=283718 RepID=A0ABP6L6F5_9ACTN
MLTGSGGTFCAGADLSAVAERGARVNRLAPDGDAPMGPSRMHLTKPLIAAIEGYAVAGGLELALLADLRVLADDAITGVFCRRFRVPLIDGGTVRLPRIIGQGRALDLSLTGRTVGAAEALAMGQALMAAQDLAREIAAFPQTCMLAGPRKCVPTVGPRLALDDGMRAEFRGGLDAIASGETIAGANRFHDGTGRHGGF